MRSNKSTHSQPAAADLCWGKQSGYPWWPCRRLNPTAAQRKLPRTAAQSVFVEFCGGKHEVAWMSKSSVNDWDKFFSVHSKKSKSRAFKEAMSDAGFDKTTSVKAEEEELDRQQEGDDEKADMKTAERTPSPTSGSTRVKQESEETPDIRSATVKEESADGLSDYEQARLRLIQDNEKMMQSLGLATGSSILGDLDVAKAGSLGVRARAAPKRKRVSEGPTRRSSRIKGDVPAPDYVGEKLVQASVSFVRSDDREPEKVLNLHSSGGTELYGKKYLKKLQELSEKAEEDETIPSDVLAYAGRLAKLKVGERGITKVVPDRIIGLAVHPGERSLVVAVGDKSGHVGIWNADKKEMPVIKSYRPHKRHINRLQFHPTNPSILYSTSRDGTVRSFDIDGGARSFGIVTSIRRNDADLQYSTLDNTGNSLYLCDSAGIVTCFDQRSGSSSWEMQMHEKRVNTVDLHPNEQHFFATASVERTIKIWDARQLKSSKSGVVPVCEFADTHNLNCAKFSPTGAKLAAVGMSSQLIVLDNPTKKCGELVPESSVTHDNRTGRWLSPFHLEWDKKVDFSFVVGSMKHPRQMQVYRAGNGYLQRIMSLQDPDWMGSVQSRSVFHPTLDVVVGANSSGKVHIFR